MEKSKIKSTEHYAYPLPFKSELCEMGYEVYRTNSALERKAQWLFSHVSIPKRMQELYLDVSTSGSRMLTRNMCIEAVRATLYFVEYPQRFGGSFENLMMQILVRMWRQTFRHTKFQMKEVDKYIPTSMKLLAIDNGFFELLLETVVQGNYVKVGEDLIKCREFIPKNGMLSNGKGSDDELRGRIGLGTQEGRSKSNFEYLANLE